MLKILLADDHQILREGIRRGLEVAGVVAGERELEQRDGRREPVEYARAEDLAGLGQREHGGEVALPATAAQRERPPPRESEREEPGHLPRAPAEIDEPAAARVAALAVSRRWIPSCLA